ncbi:MAG: hypothetical protein ACRD8A_06470 [Candidatus Acidiferrales bacterium]
MTRHSFVIWIHRFTPNPELCQLVKTESAPNLKIRIRNGKCEVSASKRTVVLSCAESSSFPESPDGEAKPQGQILASAFDAALCRALFCISTESGRYSTDVLKLELHGAIFRVIGTDGHRLSVIEGAGRVNGNPASSSLLLRSTAAILSRLGLADEPRWVEFSTYGSEQDFIHYLTQYVKSVETDTVSMKLFPHIRSLRFLGDIIPLRP